MRRLVDSFIIVGRTCRQKCTRMSETSIFWNFQLLRECRGHLFLPEKLLEYRLLLPGITEGEVKSVELSLGPWGHRMDSLGRDGAEQNCLVPNVCFNFTLKREKTRKPKLSIPWTVLWVCTPSAHLLTSASPSAPAEHHLHFLSGKCPKILRKHIKGLMHLSK